MRMLIGLMVVALVFGVLTTASNAGVEPDFEAMCYESVTSPGETVRAACVLSNDTDRPVTYKVKGRIRGDDEILRGKASRARGKKVRFKVRVEPGQTVVREFELPVPGKASGPIEALFKVKGPDGKRKVRQSLFARETADDSPLSEEPTGRSGTVLLDEGAVHALRFEPDEGDAVRLVGHEAVGLEALMRAKSLISIRAEVDGYAMGDMPLRFRRHMFRDDEPPFYLLAYETEDLGSLDGRIVPYRPLLAGTHRDIDVERMTVMRSEEEWDAAMIEAGIDIAAMLEDDHGPFTQTMMTGGGMGHDDDHDLGRGFGGHHRDGHGGPFHHDAPGEENDHGHGFVHDDLDDMDFGREMMIAVFAGDKPTDGYRVEMRGITREDDGSLTCRYAIVSPDDDAPGMRQMTRPFLVVAVPWTDGPVRFVVDE